MSLYIDGLTETALADNNNATPMGIQEVVNYSWILNLPLKDIATVCGQIEAYADGLTNCTSYV